MGIAPPLRFNECGSGSSSVIGFAQLAIIEQRHTWSLLETLRIICIAV